MLKTGYVLSNRYRVIKPLGQGGQSNVYLLKDLRLKGKRWVAKEMVAQYADARDQSLAKKHFEMEANILATLEHPNLPKVIDYFSQGGKHYLIMEYLKGEDLGKMLDRRKKGFPEEQVAGWGMQIATVLYYLHRQKKPIIFRDIKPSNIMICAGTVKLIDFGIARHFHPSKKGDTLRIGSPGYSPPEQYSGQTDPRSDVYSLGVTMHHLLTGIDPSKTQTPFKLPPIKAHNEEVSSMMIQIVETATQIDPDKRHQSALDLKKDLKEVVQQSRRPSPSQPTRVVTQVNPPSGSMTVPSPPPQPQTEPPDESKAPSTKFMPEEDEQGRKTNEVPLSEVESQTNQEPSQQPPAQQQPGAKPADKKKAKPGKKRATKKFKTMLIIKAAALLVIIALIAGIYILSTGQGWKIFPWTKPTRTVPVGVPEDGAPLEKGIALLGLGKPGEAIEQLKIARFQAPDDPEPLIYLNNAYARAGGGETVEISILVPPEKNESVKSLLAGAAVAQKQVNLQGGVRGKSLVIEIFRIQEGEKGNSKILGRVFSGSPIALIAPLEGKSLEAVIKLSSKKNTPLLVPGRSPVNLPAGMLDWFIPDREKIASIGRMAGARKFKKVAMVKEAGTPGSVTAVLREVLKEENVTITATVEYQKERLGFERNMNRVKAGKPGAVIFIGDDNDAAFFASTLRKAKVKVPVLIPPYAATDVLIEKLAGGDENVLASVPLYSGPENFPASNFLIRFKDSFKNVKPGVKSAVGSDLVMLTAFAGRKTFPEAEKVFQFLKKPESNKQFKGAVGVFAPKDGKIQRWWAIVQPQKKGWKETGGFKF